MLFKRVFVKTLRSFQNASHLSFRSSNKVDVGKYVLLSIPVATFGLGTWQIQRRQWKLKLIEQLESKSKSAPVNLLENLDNLEKLEYCPVFVKGMFDHSKEVYIGPRSLVDAHSEKSSSLFSSQSRIGYHVVTPFQLTEEDMTILVNRGWVPKSKLPPDTRQEGQVTEEIELVGLVRLDEKKPVFSASKKPGSNLFHFRDIGSIAMKCSTSPIFLDADVGNNVPGGPQGGQTRLTLRNEHLSYIITWYSLSSVTAWLWYSRYFRHVPVA